MFHQKKNDTKLNIDEGKNVKILETEIELRALLSPTEKEAYLSQAWQTSDQEDMTTDMVTMSFESPARGKLVIKGGHKIGEKNFVFKLSTEFNADSGAGETINRTLTLVGDAQTGVITAMLPEGRDAQIEISVMDWAMIQDHLEALGPEAVCQLQKDGFVAFSAGNVTIPDVIYLPFKEQSGDLHLKGAHSKGGAIYVLKIATGFPGNKDRGMSATQGLMIAFDARTGDPLVVLEDEGHLTDLRTAIAGRNAAEEMMPPEELTGIGVLGTGTQARLQIEQLKSLYPDCQKLTVWGHTDANTALYAEEMRENGWDITIADTPKGVADKSNLIITTTPSEVALLDADDITNPNTLIIAIGADMPGKVELSPALLKKADSVVIDSITQGKDHGNAAVPLKDNIIHEDDLQEFGDVVRYGLKNSENAHKLRIFLSSGIGVQDLQIVQAVIFLQGVRDERSEYF